MTRSPAPPAGRTPRDPLPRPTGGTLVIDAMLGATALAAPGPVTILTSDPEDLTALCGRPATVIRV